MRSPNSRSRSPSLRDGSDGDDIHPFEARTPVDDEETPLLATDLPPDMIPDKRFQQTVLVMSCIFIALVEVYTFLTAAPLQEIMEDFICHSHYPDHVMNQPTTTQDARCKEPEVQKILAMVRGWSVSCESWVPLLVQIPYGIIADKYGRRPVLFLSLFGVLVEGILGIIVLLHPQTFSVWALVPTALAYFIGGGPPMATAMIWTILCDTIPSAQRTSAFYLISALGVILSAILNPISAWLMSIDPWLPMWIGITCMALGTLSALFLPETLRLRKQADAVHRRRGSSSSEALLSNEEVEAPRRAVPPKAYIRELILGAKKNTEHIWRFILASKSVMLLVAASGFYFPVRTSFELSMLQYTTKRFDWSWSTATYYFTIAKVTGVLMLLVILPITSKLMIRGLGDNPLKRDLYLARFSAKFVLLACVLAAASFSPPVLIISFVFWGISAGALSQMRALATGVVEPHTLATLNTMISSMETMMGSVGAPVFGWLMSRGMDLGGAWLGLPFLASTVFALGICLFLWLFRTPRAFL